MGLINWAEVARQLPGRDRGVAKRRYENTLTPENVKTSIKLQED
jgi:hypothetical protein